LSARDLPFVRATPDPEGAESHHLFELRGGRGEPGPVYHLQAQQPPANVTRSGFCWTTSRRRSWLLVRDA